jgi:hypothetical protein
MGFVLGSSLGRIWFISRPGQIMFLKVKN